MGASEVIRPIAYISEGFFSPSFSLLSNIPHLFFSPFFDFIGTSPARQRGLNTKPREVKLKVICLFCFLFFDFY